MPSIIIMPIEVVYEIGFPFLVRVPKAVVSLLDSRGSQFVSEIRIQAGSLCRIFFCSRKGKGHSNVYGFNYLDFLYPSILL